MVATIVFFIIYSLTTKDLSNNISNFGLYLPVLLFFMCIHGILSKEHNSLPLSTVFSQKQIAVIMCLSIVIFGLITLALGSEYTLLFIMVNALFAFIYICNIVLSESLKKGERKMIKTSNYEAALRQLQQEELLKTEFSNFLHDDVLQDLLSIKNMMGKAHRPDIQDIIIETLNGLNTHIREQMQDYHPIILKNLTPKENFENLLGAISKSFFGSNIVVSFDCSNSLFLVEPYNLLVYRLLRELVTNVYKHSDGNRAWITLSQENGIISLCVSDDGTTDVTCLNRTDPLKHKGIASIKDQIKSIEGTVVISNNIPHGIRIQITIPMKGDDSYKYFIG